MTSSKQLTMTKKQINKMRSQFKKDWHKHPEIDWAQKAGTNLAGLNLTAFRGADASSFSDSQATVHMVVTGVCAKGATLDVILGKKKLTIEGDREVKPPIFLKPGDSIHAVVQGRGGEHIAVRFSIHGYEMMPHMVSEAKRLVKELQAAS